MSYALIAGSLLCGWALLSVLGGERQRRLNEIEASPPAEEPAEAAALPANSGPAKGAAPAPAKPAARRA